MKILYHPKKVTWLGFEPYVAPEGFDRKAQPVDIYDVFRNYYSVDQTAKFIFSVKDTAATTVLVHGTTYRYGYTSGGVDYIVDHNIATTLTASYHGYSTTIQVADTSLFPATGVVKFGSNNIFTYTSKTATSFTGGSQQVVESNGASLYSRNLTITWVSGSTKRWVIVNNVYNAMQEASCTLSCTTIDWIYCGNKINKITTATGNGSSSSLVKYIHIHKVDNITEFSYHSYNSSLTGRLYLTDKCVMPPQFRYCTGLTGELVIPSGVTTIAGWGFNGATGLTGLTIPNSVTSIGQEAFSGCTGFTTLTLSNTLTTIGISAFHGCSNITSSLTIPDSVTTIGARAFYSMTRITGSLVIPLNVTSIGEGAFSNDPFSSIDVSANPTRYHVHDEVLYQESNHMAIYSRKGNTGTITFESDTLYIGANCCENNARTGNIVIPTGVLTVNNYAFSGCTFSGSITIAGSVTTLGYGSFQSLANATSIVFNEGLITIGTDAFRYCVKMNFNVVLPDSLVTIGQNAFNAWNSMVGSFTLGTVASSLTTIGGGFSCAFTGALYIPPKVTDINTGTYSSFQYVNNPSSITSGSTNYPAYDNVLYDCKTVGVVRPFLNAKAYSGTLTLRADTTIITTPYWGGVFEGSSNRTGTLTIPATLTSIGARAFFGCTGLTGLAFSGSPTITAIGANAFHNCSGLTGTLTLPASLSTAAGSIGAGAFSGSTVANRPSFTVCNSYNNTQPGATTTSFAFQSGGVTDAIPLHVLTGTTSYTAAPWTNTAIFSSVTADL